MSLLLKSEYETHVRRWQHSLVGLTDIDAYHKRRLVNISDRRRETGISNNAKRFMGNYTIGRSKAPKTCEVIQMHFELDAMATILQLLLDTGENVPPDAYPGAIPPGYGGFPPGSPGSSLPNLPIPGDPGADENRSA